MLGLAVALLLQKSVALPDRAMRLDALLGTMSTATGEAYRTTAPMAARIVLVAGPPRPAAALRADLATATWGAWSRTGGEWRLEPDRAGVAARERTRLAARFAAVRAAQARLTGLTVRPFDEATAREIVREMARYDKAEKGHAPNVHATFRKVEDALPSSVALRRLVAGIDPGTLTALEKGRAAFSDRPTRLQHPLGPGVGSVLRDAERAQNLWATVYTDGDSFHEGRNSWLSADPRAHAEPVGAGGLRAIVNAQADGNGIRMTGKFFDAQGDERLEGFLHLDLEAQASRDDPEPAVDSKEPDTPVSAAARAYGATVDGKPDAATRAVFLAPDQIEPLDLLVGEGLRETAKALGRPLTAWLDDSLLDLTLPKDRGLSPHGWLHELWSRDYAVREGGGGIVLQPRHEIGNLDRRLLAGLVQAIDAAGFLPFERAADYAAAEPRMRSAEAEEAVGIAVRAVLPGAYETAHPEWDFLRLWGGFAPAQRETLRNGGLVPWAAVAPALQNALVEAMLQSGPNDIRPDYRKGNVKGRDIDQEPSEVLASPVAMGDGVQGEGRTNLSVMGREPDSVGGYSAGSATPYSLARAVLTREKSPDAEPRDGMPRTLPAAYVLGRQFFVGFSVPLGTPMVWRRSASGGEFDLRQVPVPLDSLPESFLQPYRKALEKMRRNPPPNE